MCRTRTGSHLPVTPVVQDAHPVVPRGDSRCAGRADAARGSGSTAAVLQNGSLGTGDGVVWGRARVSCRTGACRAEGDRGPARVLHKARLGALSRTCRSDGRGGSPLSHCCGMVSRSENPMQRCIRALGGIASTAELLQAGHSPEFIRMSVNYGAVTRIRKGWYATKDVSADVIRAWRIGGQLSCVSAAVHHGVLSPEAAAGELHVNLRRQASRLRTPHNHRARLAEHPDQNVVLHWSRLQQADRRKPVSLPEALEQLRQCRPNLLPTTTR